MPNDELISIRHSAFGLRQFLRPWVFRHSSFSTYFAGKSFVNSTAQLTHRRSLDASCQPAGSTMTQPRIGRPVMSNSRVYSSARTCRAISGPKRRMRWPFHSPQQTLPLRRKAVPPKSCFSKTCCRLRTPFRRARSWRSWAMRFFSLGMADWETGNGIQGTGAGSFGFLEYGTPARNAIPYSTIHPLLSHLLSWRHKKTRHICTRTVPKRVEFTTYRNSSKSSTIQSR